MNTNTQIKLSKMVSLAQNFRKGIVEVTNLSFCEHIFNELYTMKEVLDCPQWLAARAIDFEFIDGMSFIPRLLSGQERRLIDRLGWSHDDIVNSLRFEWPKSSAIDAEIVTQIVTIRPMLKPTSLLRRDILATVPVDRYFDACTACLTNPIIIAQDQRTHRVLGSFAVRTAAALLTQGNANGPAETDVQS